MNRKINNHRFVRLVYIAVRLLMYIAEIGFDYQSSQHYIRHQNFPSSY